MCKSGTERKAWYTYAGSIIYRSARTVQPAIQCIAVQSKVGRMGIRHQPVHLLQSRPKQTPRASKHADKRPPTRRRGRNKKNPTHPSIPLPFILSSLPQHTRFPTDLTPFPPPNTPHNSQLRQRPRTNLLVPPSHELLPPPPPRPQPRNPRLPPLPLPVPVATRTTTAVTLRDVRAVQQRLDGVDARL